MSMEHSLNTQHTHNKKLIREITPLSERDCLYIVKRYKQECDYPIHTHDMYELNFIHGGKGVTRIVGDSVESIDDWELVLITQSDLEHTWEGTPTYPKGTPSNYNTSSHPVMVEITLQFSPDLLSESMLQKNQLLSIRTMFTQAKHGLLFSPNTIQEIAPQLNQLTDQKGSFEQILSFLRILYTLSKDARARALSSTSFASVVDKFDSRRVQKVDEYVQSHYKENISLRDLAQLVNMSEVGFSRFFRMRTGMRLSDYLIGIRIGHATRMLVDTTHTISEIAYTCGFNNISNFNRQFLRIKHITPNAFRQTYHKTKTII